jgi:hypothetical protein
MTKISTLDAIKILLINKIDKFEYVSLDEIMKEIKIIEVARLEHPVIALVEDIRYKVCDLITFFKSDLPIGFKNLIKYASIIWKDRDWDSEFLYKLIQFKLDSMARYHKNHGHTESSEDNAKQMFECANLFSNILDDKYENNEDIQQLRREHKLKEAWQFEKNLRDRDKNIAFNTIRDYGDEWCD